MHLSQKIQPVGNPWGSNHPASAYLDTFPFDLVDIGLEYGEFKGKLNVFEAGSKQNNKVSTLANQVGQMLLQCSEFTTGGSTECLNRSHLFKICLKRLFKKLCKLQKLKRPTENDDEVVFVPELLSYFAIQNLTLFLQETNSDHPIQVVTLFTCPKVVFDL